MKNILKIIPFASVFSLLLMGCGRMNKSQKGVVIGATGSAAIGAIIGKMAGNNAMGAILGSTIGGVGGALIGNQMDKQAEEMKKAIPDAKVERVGEGIVVEFSDKILFGFNRSNLDPKARENLNNLAAVFKQYPDTEIEVQGHTDNRGSERYNLKLSLQRASTVKKYLAENSINANRIQIKAFGEAAPKYSNDTEEGQAQNRRVAFLISANQKMVADAAKEAGKN